jgi:hypothetical protein
VNEDASAGGDLAQRWREAWPDALRAWGTSTRVHPPRLHVEPVDGVPSFAWYDSRAVEVHIDLAQVRRLGLDDHPVAVLAHEIGHHVLAPGDRRTGVRIAARVRAGLVDRDALVPVVANLWNDLLVNDRLQRSGRADLVGVWHALGTPSDPLMALVLRACEVLWEQPRGSLAGTAARVDEAAALLCARLVRAYADDPVGGAGGFAALVRTSLSDDDLDGAAPQVRLVVCGDEAHGLPHGVAADPGLGATVLHPSLDARVVGEDVGVSVLGEEAPPAVADASATGTAGASLGNVLLPPDLHALLSALGETTSLEDVAVAWYREHAAPHLVPFPVRRTPAVPDPLLGGLDTWELGDDLGDVDWTGTVTASPVVVPGLTTRRRAVLDDEVQDRIDRPVDLDLYLDSSGSMPDPKRFSWVALAGAVLALSALRAGARVQATTWSGPGQVAGTDGFVRDPDRVLRAVVAYFGGGTAFPRALLEATFLGLDGERPTATGPTHVAVVSDTGVSSMSWVGRDRDGGTLVTDVAARALAAAGGGGSLVLDVPAGWDPWATGTEPVAVWEALRGYDVYRVGSDQQLVDFARDFARRTWGGTR